MAKKPHATGGRAAKLRRRALRAAKQRGHHPDHPCAGHERDDLVRVSSIPQGMSLTGWHVMGSDEDIDDLDDVTFAGPDDALLDTSACPVADRCAGCGATAGLHPVTAAFSKPGGFDVGCVTLCSRCDGRSFLHLLSPAGLEEAFTRHAAHQQQL